MDNHICKYCSSIRKSKVSLIQHEIRCKSNPDAIVVVPSYGMLGKKGSNHFIKAKSLGLTYIIKDETRRKMSESAKKQIWTDERRQKHSESMKQSVLSNPDSYSKKNVVGRVKNIEYKGHILKGSWEVTVATWLDKNSIKWDMCDTPFPYEWNGKIHYYFPDFYLPDKNIYIEVKGYARDRDLCKWDALSNTNTLVVIDKRSIYDLDNLQFQDLLSYRHEKAVYV